VTLACAAVDDITAWTILAFVVSVVRGAELARPLWATIGATAAFVLVMLFVVRPALRPIIRYYRHYGWVTQNLMGAMLILVLLSALTTEWLGIHALFGAFALGAALPKDPQFVRELSGKLEDLVVVFFLPLYFAYTGLRTHIGLLAGTEMWLYTALVLTVAVAGKLGGSTVAARATGLSWSEATALGVLMNTRGLMGLVILSVGLDLGVVSPALFTMMVLMALVTTAMTTPLLAWIHQASAEQPATRRVPRGITAPT
jgi:Kef-type K+ transport system membrane component KefB